MNATPYFVSAVEQLVAEHRTENGTALLPGTGHLELMLAALAHAGLPATPGLRNVALLEPLVVPDGHPVTVKVTIAAPDAKGVRVVRIESDHGRGRSWSTHSEAELVTDAALPSAVLDLAAAKRRCGLDGGRRESGDGLPPRGIRIDGRQFPNSGSPTRRVPRNDSRREWFDQGPRRRSQCRRGYGG